LAQAEALDKLEGVAISAQQDVLAIVEDSVVHFDATCASAQRARGFEQGDALAMVRQLRGSRAAGPASPNYGSRTHALILVTLSPHPGFPGQPQLSDRRERDALVEDVKVVTLDFHQQRAIDRCHDQARSLRTAVLHRQQ